MDTPNPSAIPTAASPAPVHIGAVGMMVRDLDRVAAYYRAMLGLTVQEHTRQFAILGVGGVALLELFHRPDALPDDSREAGLYHTAFLMPTRADLARWILHAARARVPFTGASDHDVSEAIYLDDPEGNGVEVYSDRPREKWRRDGESIFQKTDPLDIDAIIREIDPATATYPSAPEGLRIGHIHLRVESGRKRFIAARSVSMSRAAAPERLSYPRAAIITMSLSMSGTVMARAFATASVRASIGSRWKSMISRL